MIVSDDPTSLSELSQQLNQLYPQLPDGASPNERMARRDAIFNGFLNSPLTSEDIKEDLRNTTWQDNHDELTRVIGNLIGENRRMPTVNQMANETGLSRQTIHKHLKEFYRSANYQSQVNQFRMLSDRVLASLYTLAIGGDVRAAKVFLDAVGGLPLQQDSPSENTNFIQVNNNIKIDQVTFTTLPEAVQQQITQLILQGLQNKIQQSDNQS